MARIIHARLDSQTETILNELQRRLRWRDSKIVREGIKALNSLFPIGGRRKIIGLGRFKSGKSDLGSNKKYLEGFGR